MAYKKGGQYKDISWNRMGEMVRKLASFLMSRGITREDNITLFSSNRYEWWVADLAILSIGAVNVPIYATNSAEEARYIIDHSGSKVCFVDSQNTLEKIARIKDRLPRLELIVIFDPSPKKRAGVFTFSEAIENGGAHDTKDELKRRLESIRPSDLASIIYTSGTMGDPKGVMLSHNNFVSNISQILADFSKIFSENDIFLSFLPLSHALERTTGYYLPVAIGAKVAFAQHFSTIQENMSEVRPTVIVSVPRLYEKIHAGILAKVEESSTIRRAIFYWTADVAAENLPYACTGRQRKGFFALKYHLADRLTFLKIKTALGMGRIKFAVSGGAPLSMCYAEFFLGMGVTVLEGFGLTETTPVTNVNRPHHIKPGTVGPPLKDTTIKISKEGEILIKGPQVMLGYYRDEQANRDVFTEDGFLKTGDIGSIDKDGYLSITGRKKEIIITAGGKNISPQNLENSLKEARFIEHTAVIGDRMKYLSALIIPAFDVLMKWAENQDIAFKGKEDLIRDDRVIGLYERVIRDYTKQFSGVEQIKKFRLLSNEWTQGTGELTPTLKYKRRIIEKKYAREIEGMYS